MLNALELQGEDWIQWLNLWIWYCWWTSGFHTQSLQGIYWAAELVSASQDGFLLHSWLHLMTPLLCGNRQVVAARKMWLRSLSQYQPQVEEAVIPEFTETSAVTFRLNQHFLTVLAPRASYKVSLTFRTPSLELSQSQLEETFNSDSFNIYAQLM
jgi:hypothetical protein